MNFVTLFAHGADQHSESTSSAEHLFTHPLIAISLYVLAHIALWYVLNTKDRKKYMLPAILGLNLIVGIGTFSLVPAVSIIAITLGITAALIVALGSIAA